MTTTLKGRVTGRIRWYLFIWWSTSQALLWVCQHVFFFLLFFLFTTIVHFFPLLRVVHPPVHPDDIVPREPATGFHDFAQDISCNAQPGHIKELHRARAREEEELCWD